MEKNQNLFDLRKNYTLTGFSIGHALADPLAQFSLWFDQAVRAQLPEPNAMTLATTTPDGVVSARVVLLKEIDQKGFVFFTNYNSRKGYELSLNPRAALSFLWLELERQVRIEGSTEKLSPNESDNYFKSRPRESQLGAWASDQSKEIASREALMEKYNELEKKYNGKTIPRPSHWGGYRLIPNRVEFWQGRPGRMHDRILYTLSPDKVTWGKKILAP
jgi:pyridoxamine 5'-phosphate oxidase